MGVKNILVLKYCIKRIKKFGKELDVFMKYS